MGNAINAEVLAALKLIVQNEKWDFRSHIRTDVLAAADSAIARAEAIKRDKP